MDNLQRLREIIRQRIHEMLDEISTSAGAGPYLTPGAFVGDKHDNTNHMKSMAKRIGYTLTKKGEKDTKKGDRLNEHTELAGYSEITAHGFRGNLPQNLKQIEKLSSIHDYQLTERGKQEHLKPADHHEDSHRSMEEILKLSLRGEYTPLPGEDLEAVGVGNHQVVRSLMEQKLITMKSITKLLGENYYTYRNDPTKQPHQKIGEAIAEVSRQLNLVERALRLNSRLQKECGVTNDKLWKRTSNHMVKLESRLIRLAGRLREMRG